MKAVFFDLDNTLVDTAAAGRRAIEEVLPRPRALRPGRTGLPASPFPLPLPPGSARAGCHGCAVGCRW